MYQNAELPLHFYAAFVLSAVKRGIAVFSGAPPSITYARAGFDQRHTVCSRIRIARGSNGLAELLVIELRVKAAARNQLSMPALLDDPAVGNDGDPSAFLMVERRCATTSVVRPLQSSSSACWIRISVVLSSALVASSKMRIGGFFKRRARWRGAVSARRRGARHVRRSGCRSPPAGT